MAPSLAKKAEPSLSISASSSLVGSLGSAAPVVLVILLLLLCFPCKRKKRQLSTRVLKRERNSSQLIHMAKLEDEPGPERKSLEDENIYKGNVLPHQQEEKQLNMNGVAAGLRHGNASSPKDRRMAIRKHQMMEKSPKLEVEHLRGSGSHTSGPPNVTTPNAVQLRKLPMTPKEAHISRTEPLKRSMDNQVYESIRLKETDLHFRDGLVETKDSDVTSGTIPKSPKVQEHLAGSVGSSGMDSRTAEFNGTLLQTGTNWLPGQSQETGSVMVAPLQPVFDPEKRLSTLYARVRKRPKASPQPQAQSLSHDKSMEEEEEEPPPIPEKRFEDVYETLSVETEVQIGAIPGTAAVSPPEA